MPPHEDEDLQLGGLLSLNLHEFNTDVEEICDQATKEEKIEARYASFCLLTPSTRVVSIRRGRGWFLCPNLSCFGPRRATACSRRGRVDGVGRRHATATPSTRCLATVSTRCAAQVNLGALNERWAKIEFLCDFYKGTDVPFLKFGEEDYEALENDQLTVQGMMASRYVAQFEKEVPCGPFHC